MPRSYVGQVAHVSMTSWVTSQEADITRRSNEAACCFRLGRWGKNSTNSYPRPDAFNRRVPRACLVPQCSYPPYWPHHQRRLAIYDLIPASYPSGQPSDLRRHPTCWDSSQWSHIVSSTPPCHGAWTSAPFNTHRSSGCKRTGSQIETPICNLYTATHQFFLTTTTYVRRTGRITNVMRSGRTTPQDSAFSSPTPAPTPWSDPPKKSLGPAQPPPQRCWAFPLTLDKWGMASPAAVSVVQKNKPSTMLSSNVQLIDIPMDCMV